MNLFMSLVLFLLFPQYIFYFRRILMIKQDQKPRDCNYAKFYEVTIKKRHWCKHIYGSYECEKIKQIDDLLTEKIILGGD